MAQIDRFLAMMEQRNAMHAMLLNDRPGQVLVNGQQMAGPVVSTIQLEAILQEITPTYLQPILPDQPQNATYNFTYQSPHGLFDIMVERAASFLQVSISPATTQSTSVDTSVQQCSRCGVPLTQGAQFCSRCGAPVEFLDTVPPASAAPQESPVQKKKSSKVVSVCAGCGLILLVIFGFIVAISNQVEQGERAAQVAMDRVREHTNQQPDIVVGPDVKVDPPVETKPDIQAQEGGTAKSYSVIERQVGPASSAIHVRIPPDSTRAEVEAWCKEILQAEITTPSGMINFYDGEKSRNNFVASYQGDVATFQSDGLVWFR